jgi:hypothetical protein
MDKFIEEISLYKNKNEYMIRLLCWIGTWIGGILAVRDSSDKRALSGGYLMFSLSMLLELAPKTNNKSKLSSRIYYAVIIVILIALTMLAFSGLLSSTDSYRYIKIDSEFAGIAAYG